MHLVFRETFYVLRNRIVYSALKVKVCGYEHRFNKCWQQYTLVVGLYAYVVRPTCVRASEDLNYKESVGSLYFRWFL